MLLKKRRGPKILIVWGKAAQKNNVQFSNLISDRTQASGSCPVDRVNRKIKLGLGLCEEGTFEGGGGGGVGFVRPV